MHEYSSVSSSASNITIASTRVLPLQIETYRFLPQAKRKMQFLPRLQPAQEALAEVAGRPRECPVGLDDQLVEDRGGLKS